MINTLGLVAVLALAPALVAAAAATECTATSGAFTWGFKESFRAYVSGSIASGEWTTEGDIGYATPAFSTDALTGELTLDTMTGELAVDGAIRFTGHEGILDTTVANPRLQFDGPDRFVMVVDVTGTTQSFVEVNAEAVPFLEGDLGAGEWIAETGALVLDAVPLTLTAEGADAFGTYPAGEKFDPITITIAAEPGCAQQAIDSRADAQRAPFVVVGLVITAGVALGAGLAVLLRRRRRDPDGPRPAPSDA